MGAQQAKPTEFGEGHPERFYDGCTKVVEGCYTVSEIYFTQAIEQHPGHAFWTSVMDAAVEKGGPREQVASRSTSPVVEPLGGPAPGLPRALPDGAVDSRAGIFCQADKNETDVNAGESVVPAATTTAISAVPHNTATSTQRRTSHVNPSSSLQDSIDLSLSFDGRATLVFPVDRRLVDAQDYARLLTDIGRIYHRKATNSSSESQEMARRLSMLYNARTAVRLQAMLHLLQSHFARHNATGDEAGKDMFCLYRKRSAQGLTSALRAKAKDTSKHLAGNANVNQETQWQDGHNAAEIHTHDDTVCIFWESVQFYWTVNVLSYITMALRFVRTAETPLPPATVKAVFDLSFKCFDALETQLLPTAEVNASFYIGALTARSIAYLRSYSKESTLKEQSTVSASLPNTSVSVPSGRSNQEADVAYLRLSGTSSFCDEQVTFLRLAKHFNKPSIPLLETSKLACVELCMEFNASIHRPVKLMTPLDNNFAWYVSLEFRNAFDRHASTPGRNSYLLENCGIAPGTSARDGSLFTAAGLEEMCFALLRVGALRAMIARCQGKVAESQELAKTTTQLSLDMYGGPSPVSELVEMVFQQVSDNAAV